MRTVVYDAKLKPRRYILGKKKKKAKNKTIAGTHQRNEYPIIPYIEIPGYLKSRLPC